MKKALYLGSICILLLIMGCGSQPKADYEWTFIYYMSYDNDLAIHGPTILDELEKGVKDSNIAVTVLFDDQENNGLKRHAITSEASKMEQLDTDNSASVHVLSDYLEWARKTYPAKHYVITFLNHGGRLDEMCLDNQPDGNNGPQWLSAQLAGPVLRDFREKAQPGNVDLLFLQQCGRGTIQNIYNFRNTADAIMTSQLGVASPNEYYEPALKWVQRETQITGRKLARQIMTSDKSFNNYVCVDGTAVNELPMRLDPLVNTLLGNRKSRPARPERAILCFECSEERNYDLVSWLKHAYQKNNCSTESLDTFTTWLFENLILEYAVQPLQREMLKDLCGLSIVVPEVVKTRDAYPNYPFYKASNLDDLWQTMYPSRTQ